MSSLQDTAPYGEILKIVQDNLPIQFTINKIEEERDNIILFLKHEKYENSLMKLVLMLGSNSFSFYAYFYDENDTILGTFFVFDKTINELKYLNYFLEHNFATMDAYEIINGTKKEYMMYNDESANISTSWCCNSKVNELYEKIKHKLYDITSYLNKFFMSNKVWFLGHTMHDYLISLNDNKRFLDILSEKLFASLPDLLLEKTKGLKYQYDYKNAALRLFFIEDRISCFNFYFYLENFTHHLFSSLDRFLEEIKMANKNGGAVLEIDLKHALSWYGLYMNYVPEKILYELYDRSFYYCYDYENKKLWISTYDIMAISSVLSYLLFLSLVSHKVLSKMYNEYDLSPIIHDGEKKVKYLFLPIFNPVFHHVGNCPSKIFSVSDFIKIKLVCK